MSATKPRQLTPFGYALAGALGGCFSNAVVYPLDIVKTRIQAATVGSQEDGDKKKPGVVSLLMQILKEEGIVGYYKGFTATMINTFSMRQRGGRPHNSGQVDAEREEVDSSSRPLSGLLGSHASTCLRHQPFCSYLC